MTVPTVIPLTVAIVIVAQRVTAAAEAELAVRPTRRTIVQIFDAVTSTTLKQPKLVAISGVYVVARVLKRPSLLAPADITNRWTRAAKSNDEI